jgi:hypothetical protein
MRRTHTAILLLTVCFAACLSGCASYVNIPPQPGDTAIHKPDMIPVPELMTDALVWATARYPVEPPFAVNLPPDTPRVTYNNVVERGTRGRGVPMSADVEHLPTYHIAEVRIRGTRAQVDIILPRGQKASATTVTLRSTVSGWRMQDARSWIAGVVPVPFANYIPAYSSVYDDEETAEAMAEEPPLVEDDTPRAPLVRGVPRQAQPVAQPVAEPEESVGMELEEESSSSVVVTKKPAQPDAVPVGEAIQYILHLDGTISRDGALVDLPTAFAGIGKESAVHLEIERGADGSEASTAEAVIASFRIRGVKNLTVERLPTATPEK